MNLITTNGKIEFEPENKTKKHELQASWKRVAMVLIAGDIAEYYAWFIKRRYSIVLNKPLRGAHVSFINDRFGDMTNHGERSLQEAEDLWKAVKLKWDGRQIDITLNVEPRTDDRSWWLNLPEEHRDGLQAIRNELGLGRPYFGMHMSLGYANEKFIDHSTYIHRLIKKGLIA